MCVCVCSVFVFFVLCVLAGGLGLELWVSEALTSGCLACNCSLFQEQSIEELSLTKPEAHTLPLMEEILHHLQSLKS